MVCESCRQNESKFIREILSGKVVTNIFLCESCEDDYQKHLNKTSDEKVA